MGVILRDKTIKATFEYIVSAECKIGMYLTMELYISYTEIGCLTLFANDAKSSPFNRKNNYDK